MFRAVSNFAAHQPARVSQVAKRTPPHHFRLLLATWLAAWPLFGDFAAATAEPAATNHPSATHWAFQPVRPVEPPAVKNTAWVRTEIDRFILAPLEAAGITPAGPADPRTLLRRLSFDLLGLPPSDEDVRAFVAECALAAVSPEPETARTATLQTWIDKLLASPRYGERWGRHWLDVARYSDTKGYVYGREERRFVHASTYRDWVIRAFNEDLRYDRFLLLQIAADQVVPKDSPDLAAMGFVTGGRRFIGVTHDIIDDRIDVVTRGTMALTVQCARCHDHKYDPIPIQDYYALYGVFHGCDDQLVPLTALDDPELKKRQQTLADTMAKRREEAATRLRARVGDYLAAQFELTKYPEEGFDQILADDDLIPGSVRRWRDYLLTTRDPAHPIFGPWHTLAALPDAGFAEAAGVIFSNRLATAREGLNPLVAEAFATAPTTRRELAQRYGALFATAEKEPDRAGAAPLRAFLRDADSPAVVPASGIINNEQYFPTTATEELWKLQGEVDRRWIELGAPAALVLQDRPPEPDPRVFLRGSPSRLGESVPRRFLQVVGGPDRPPFQNGSGRLELARAIIDPANPLTARVLVNRVWQHHFGTGLVRTASDFGVRAEPPTHPELLDWLARRFIADGWSLKALHRRIVSSAVYQQSALGTGDHPHSPTTTTSTAPVAKARLARFPVQRLEFEQARDAMLAASGELETRGGGKPFDLLDPNQRRRTVYALIDRQFLPGVFRTFDVANPDIHVAVRHETTVPQQALYFLNGPFVAARARALATRTQDLPPAARVAAMYHSLYQRAPTEDETSAALRFVTGAEQDAPPPPPPPRETPWRYGTGTYDVASKRVQGFVPLPHFTGTAWQGTNAWPGGDTGWAQLTAEGGHPGDTLAHAVVRRWVAPRDVRVTLTGTLRHEPEPGDGVRAFVTSSRHGELRAVTVHHGHAAMTAGPLAMRAGDTLDCVVDIGGTLNSDQFLWNPVLTELPVSEPAAVATPKGETWDARKNFDGPKPEPPWLRPWEQLAQVLFLANEFAFVD